MNKEKTTIKELENDLKEKQEQLDTIFNWIAELYDIIEEWEMDYNFILEELARIQNYCK
jgi:hypothetical protein